MLHEPVHFVVFLILVATIPTEIYTLATVFVLYAYLKEAYIDVDIAIHETRATEKNKYQLDLES